MYVKATVISSTGAKITEWIFDYLDIRSRREFAARAEKALAAGHTVTTVSTGWTESVRKGRVTSDRTLETLGERRALINRILGERP